MKRSTEIFIDCHCILNANAKVYLPADLAGVHRESLNLYLDRGVAILRLACPKASYLGMNRWGMPREQYDHRNSFLPTFPNTWGGDTPRRKNRAMDGMNILGFSYDKLCAS